MKEVSKGMLLLIFFANFCFSFIFAGEGHEDFKADTILKDGRTWVRFDTHNPYILLEPARLYNWSSSTFEIEKVVGDTIVNDRVFKIIESYSNRYIDDGNFYDGLKLKFQYEDANRLIQVSFDSEGNIENEKLLCDFNLQQGDNYDIEHIKHVDQYIAEVDTVCLNGKNRKRIVLRLPSDDWS